MLADSPHATGDHSRSISATLLGFLSFLVHSNVFISVAATSVAVSTILLAGFELEPVPLFIVFAVTLFVYTFNRLADLEEDEQNVPTRVDFVRRFGKPLFALGVILYAVATAIALFVDIPGAPAMGIPLLVAVLYSLVGLKRVLLVKNFLVGISWGLIPLGVGFYYGAPASVDILFVFVFITVALTIAAMLFDIKDIEGDSAAGISTVPILFGIAWTRRLALLGIFVLAIVTMGMIVSGPLDGQYAFLLAFLGYMAGYSVVADKSYGPLFYGFVIDGEHLFLAILLACYEFLLPSLTG